MAVQRIADDAPDLDLAIRSPVNVMVTASRRVDRAACARTIHDHSARRGRPFVAVGRGAPPARAASRVEDVDGWFEQAAGGTLFIDRVGDLSPQAQGRLLSLLAEQSRDAHGPTLPAVAPRVRVISGSHRSLGADLAFGAFSDTLFYRLNVIHIDLLDQNESGDDVMKARDIMSAPPHSCGPSSDLATVAKLMWDHDCGFVPVVDAADIVVGGITDRDICIATATRRLLPEHIAAEQAMTTPIQACLLDDSISDVLSAMRRFRIRRMPVIDAGRRLQGVISLNDIVLASNDKRDPKSAEVVATMAAICAHRPVEIAVA
jgi:CBS domain-containing protein